jgi:thiamine biosynthesis lipoprotein ApbE
MSRRGWVTLISAAWLILMLVQAASAADDSVFYYENVMGTSLELRVRADAPAGARWAEERVLREIDRLTDIFSGYESASELSRWQASSRGPVKLSPELIELLGECDRWRALSGGAFDPRVELLTELWARCAARGRKPSAIEREEALSRLSRPAWRLDSARGTAERLSDCRVSLNAIAKGYIVERACEAAFSPEHGVRGLVLNVGGDLRVCGDVERTVAIANPHADSETSEPIAYLKVSNRAVATSGSAQRGFRINGTWYSHIFDPRTGSPAAGVASATVVAERSADADALATIFNVLAPEESLRLLRSLPGVECLIVAADGRLVASPGWARYAASKPIALAAADDAKGVAKDAKTDKKAEQGSTAGGRWGDEWEVAVNFEINRPPATGRGYRRPYVAIWVEDKNGAVVRNLELMVSYGGAGPYQWVPEMKRWFQSDQARKKLDKTDMIQTMSRPTRPPGKYSVVWDGKDDHGKPLDRGEYTIFIDAAREHGTYQNMRKKVALAETPFVEELPGNVEIKAASIEYRRKASPK